MPPNVKVCINGFVLSTLLFDCSNNTSDQEGFLYGSITRNVRREISDHSMSNTQEDILISVCSSVPCGGILSFYNNVGEIKRDDLAYILGERADVQNIVGWYRFRRYSAMFPSVREQAVHQNLRDLFSNWNRLVDTSYFVFGLLSSSNLPNFATHSYDYGFFIQRRDGTFKDLPLTILNLGDTRNSYRAGSMALPFMNSSSFNSVLSSSWNFDTFFDTENQIHEFHQRLRAKLDSLQEELAASDAVNASLDDDIKRISNEMQALLATQDFENEEYLSNKSVTKTAEGVDPTISTCHVDAADLDQIQLSPGDTPCSDDEEPRIPSPASNVEIVISDANLQNLESTFLVGESLSSSDELSDVKESDAKEAPSQVSSTKPSDASETSKSLSDSDICCKTEVSAADRCESAPAGFLTHATGLIQEKFSGDESASKAPNSNRSPTKVNPPFIIYASKRSENESSPVSSHVSELKPEESVIDKLVEENSQSSSPSQDQKEQQKNDVPEESKNVVPGEAKYDILEEPKNDVPGEAKNDILEEPKNDVPGKAKNDILEEPNNDVTGEAKNVILEEPKNDDVIGDAKKDILEEPKNEVLKEQKNEILKEPKNNVLEEPKNDVCEEPKNDVPEESKKNAPEEPKNNVPEELKNNVPEELKNDVSEESKKNIPEEPKNNVPEESDKKVE